MTQSLGFRRIARGTPGCLRLCVRRLKEGLEGVEIGLIGVPFDGGVTNRTGARPRAARDSKSIEPHEKGESS